MSILSKVRVDGVDYDLMGLGGDVLPVGTEVDIDSTATIPAGWEEVDNKYEIYSTDEKCIGRWIDGKPLYRKVLSYSISGQSAYPVNVIMPTGYTSTEYIIRDMRGILYGSDYAINLNRSARWTNSETSENMNLIQTTNGIHLVITKADTEVNYFNGCDGIVIIEYTKTSDTANSPITKRIKKVSQTAPTLSQIVNTQSDSTSNSYSCGYINNLDQVIISDAEPTGNDRKPLWIYNGTANLLDYNNVLAGAKDFGIYVKDDVVIATTKDSDGRTWTTENMNWQCYLPAGTYTFYMEFTHQCTNESGRARAYPSDSAEMLFNGVITNVDTFTQTFTLSNAQTVSVMVKQYDGEYKIMIKEGSTVDGWLPYGNSIRVLNETTNKYNKIV